MNLRQLAQKASIPSSDAERVDQYADSVAGDFPSDDGYADQSGDAFAGDYPFTGDAGHIAIDGSQVHGDSDPDQSEIRLSSGILGFLEALLEEGMPEHKLPPELVAALKSKPHKMHVDGRGSDLFSVTTQTTPTGPAPIRVAYARESRRRIVITNYGPGTLWISHSSGNLINLTTGFGPTSESIAIPPPGGGVNFFRELKTTAEIWCAANVGNNTVYDVLDEFDEE